MRATAPRSGLNNDGPGGGRSCASRSAGPPLQPMGARLLCRVESLLRHIPGQIKRADSSTLRGRLFLFFILRPDRIVVGEVRGQEAIDMLQSVNVGHSAMTTVHANSVRNVVSRLETMVLMGMEIPISAIRRQIVEGFDVMVHLGRCKNGRRAVMEVAEPMHIADGEVCMNTVFKRNQQGELVKVGEFTEKTKSKLVRI